MNLPTPTTTAEIYLAAILKELQRKPEATAEVELKEPKRKAK